MPLPVTDVGSNLEENLERWAKALRFAGATQDVFNIVYSGKRRHWTAKQVARALAGRISAKRVTMCGRKLVGDGLLRQVSDIYPVVYEKIPQVHHYKSKILALAGNKLRRKKLRTKRNQKVTVAVRQGTTMAGRAAEITVDEVDQFSRVRKIRDTPPSLTPLPEKRFKLALGKMFKESGRFPDWGGETNDFFTNKLRIGGVRYSAAFALKGPGVRSRTMAPGRWGKHGNQIQKLVRSPARVFFLQFEGQIDEDSVEQLKKLVELKAIREGRKLFYGYIDKDDSLRLRDAYPIFF